MTTNNNGSKVWAYPVKQAVWGGEPETYYFSSAAERDAYCRSHDYCDKLPCRKVDPDMVRGDIRHDDYWSF